jgi:hypothetical protein
VTRDWESAAPVGLAAVEVVLTFEWVAAAAVAIAWAEGVSFALEPEEVVEGSGAVRDELASRKVLWAAVALDRARGLVLVAPG